MHAAREGFFDELEFSVSLGSSRSIGSSSFGAVASAGLKSQYTNTGGTVADAVELTITATQAPATGALTTVYVVKLHGSVLHTFTSTNWDASASLVLTFTNSGHYSTNGTDWEWRWDSWAVKRNGSSVASGSSGSKTGIIWTAAGEPCFGSAPRIGGNAAINPAPIFGALSSSSTSSSQSCDASWAGGYRMKNGGVWASYPVEPLFESPSSSGSCSPALVIPSCSTTSDASGTAHMHVIFVKSAVQEVTCDLCTNGVADPPFVWEHWTTSIEVDKYNSEISLLPSFDKKLIRLNSDYGAVIERWGTPQVLISRISGDSIDPDVDVDYVDSQREVFPAKTIFLEEVSNATAILEDVFDFTSYAPCSAAREKWTRTKLFSQVKTAGACPLADEDHPLGGDPILCVEDIDEFCYGYKGSSYPVLVSGAGDTSSELDHPDIISAYVNQIAAPHWLFTKFFPHDYESGAIRASEWPVDSARANPWSEFAGSGLPAYWGPLGDQWGSNPSLPETGTHRRYSLVTAALGEGPHQVQYKSRFGHEGGPWGLKFVQQDIQVQQNFTYDSSSTSAWTFKDSIGGTLASSFAAGGITITPTVGDTAVICELDLGVWAEKPYMLAHLAKAFTIDWSTTNVSSVAVELEGADGTAVDISTTRNTRIDWPMVTSGDYAGTWGADLSAFSDFADTGTDVASGGDSPAVMSSIERSFAFQLLPGRTAKLLRITITATSASSTVQLKYPKLHFDYPGKNYKAIVSRETRQEANFVFPDGPGLRWGNWTFWKYSDDTFEPDNNAGAPDFLDSGSQCSALDALCFKRLVLQGKAAGDGLNAEVDGLWDSFERSDSGGSRQDAAYYTLGLVIENNGVLSVGRTGLSVLVANLCQAPPSPYFPSVPIGLAAEEIGGSGQYQLAYSLAFRERKIVCPGFVRTDITDGSVAWTTPDVVASGWTRGTHSMPVDNTEADFEIVRAGITFADENRPWHGKFWVSGAAVGSGTNVSIDAHSDGRLFRAYSDGTNIVAGIRTRNGAWNDITTAVSSGWVSIRVEKRSKAPKIWLVVADGSSIKEYVSTDGVTYTMSTTLATGTLKYPASEIELDGVRYVYWLNGTQIDGLIRDRAGNTLASPTACVTGVDDAGFGVRKHVSSNAGKTEIVLDVIQSGAVVEFKSTDGIAFT